MLAGAIRRLAEGEGGFAAVVAKGDETSGSLLLQILEKGEFAGLYERAPLTLDQSQWVRLGTAEEEVGDYFSRRRRNDPDLWLIELDVPNAERFIVALASTA